jgi:hypothetical protein
MNFKKEFNDNFKTGDNISVSLSKYVKLGECSNVNQEYVTRKYLIGKTNLNESQGQVELFNGNNSMIVEYQWFNEELTGRKIIKF